MATPAKHGKDEVALRPPALSYPAVLLARQAMATRFELLLPGRATASRRAIAEEALDEIERVEQWLSLYRPDSEIAAVNARASYEPVKVSAPVFALLKHAMRLYQETGGAFDIAIGSLIKCWGFGGGHGALPSRNALASARRSAGFNHVLLNEKEQTIFYQRPGVQIDMGAIGKGFAIERAVARLHEAGIATALLHGGTSSVVALGHPPDAMAWNIAIENPKSRSPGGTPLAVIGLRDESLSVSAVWGKSFLHQGKIYGHVIDPRTGCPVAHSLLAAVVLPDATEADAFSTAMLVGGATEFDNLNKLRPGMKSLLAWRNNNGGIRIKTHGIPLVEDS